MMDHRVEDTPAVPSPWLCRAPLLVAAMLICLITGLNFHRLVPTEAPRNPMEALEVVEAWRSMHRMPVYELAPGGHSTHMYGALVPWVQGEIFRWVGPNTKSGRVLTLVSALVTVTLLVIGMRSRGSAWYMLIAWAALLGVNNRSLQYFTENRPDMTALMFATLSMLLIGVGQERQRGWLVALGSVLMLIGFFFKQTMVIFAVVPLIVLFLQGRRPVRPEIRLALMPLAVLGGAILGLKLFSPTVFHYMIEVPGAYHVDYFLAVKYLWTFLAESPLFLVLFGEWIVVDGGSLRKDRRMRWLLATLIVATPFSAIAFAKYRGAANSMLPALLAIMAFCALRLPGLLERLENAKTPRLARLMAGSIVALLLLITIFPHPGVMAYRCFRDRAYGQAIDLAASLPGITVCPEDPTIPLFAKQYVGRSIFSEYDAHPVNGAWPSSLPETALTDFRVADYVLDVIDYWDDCVNDHLLRELGFTPVEDVAIDPTCYRVWRRAGAGAAPTKELAAMNRTDR